eukprot:TRINITY_DN27822_c0_g1_i1.p1 TRINITY_DN27822_c0_g1~~TRINITY_DN27822_c0_g1_i1.p1  ORF type:complete len:689 (+),score=129.63 TRINITY_DN27822_c0_g1_i1:36-2069(+)
MAVSKAQKTDMETSDGSSLINVMREKDSTASPTVARIPRTARLQRLLVNFLTRSWPGLMMARAGVVMLHATPALSALLVLRRSWRLKDMIERRQRSVPLILLRSVYCKFKQRSLESRRAYQPAVLWKAPGERRKLLSKFLANIDHIHDGSLKGRSMSFQEVPEKPGIEKGVSISSPSQTLSRAPWRKASLTARRNSRQMLISAPSVENFLRLSDEPEPELLQPPPASQSNLGRTLQKAPERLLTSAPSVENLLRSYEPEAQASSQGKDLECLKHLELCSWYSIAGSGADRGICKDVSQIRRGNLEEWILSYWFDGAASASDLDEGEKVELQELVDYVAKWAGLPDKVSPAEWSGKNTRLKCFRMRNDPFPTVHRPLLAYMNTAFLAPAIGHQALTVFGFRPYRSGSTEYWFRPANPSSDWVRSRSAARPHRLPSGSRPLVFCHGVGVGPTMCLPTLQLLVKGLGQEHPIFLVDCAAISMRFSDDVPGAQEVTANIRNMLKVWGLVQAHFVGHSFGSFIVAWMLRYERSYVARTTFIDPVCFLLLKVLVESHELQQVRHASRMDAMEMLIKYFVLTELFVCNFVCRCFFWEESVLNMQDLDGMKSLIVLESDDLIVPTFSVRSLVIAERHRRAQDSTSRSADAGLDLLWVQDQPHAGFLVDSVANRDVSSRLQSFHTE